MASVAFSILLWLTPDDFTRQWETSWLPDGEFQMGKAAPLIVNE